MAYNLRQVKVKYYQFVISMLAFTVVIVTSILWRYNTVGEAWRCALHFTVVCSKRNAPAKGSLSYSSTPLVPTVKVIFSCKPGYKLVGPGGDICLDGGKWKIGKDPKCVLSKYPPTASATVMYYCTRVNPAVDWIWVGHHNTLCDTCSITLKRFRIFWAVNLTRTRSLFAPSIIYYDPLITITLNRIP